MGRANRGKGAAGATLRDSAVPRAGIMKVGDMVWSSLPRGPVRVEEIEFAGKSVRAAPWVASEEVLVQTSDGRRINGGMCDPYRLPPVREVEEILLQGKPLTLEEIGNEVGWTREDLRAVLEEGVERGRLDNSQVGDDDETLYSLEPDRAEEIEVGEYAQGEDRMSASSTFREGVQGVLQVGDIVETRWGQVAVSDISVCPPEIKDGPEVVSVEAVSWKAAGGRDFAVSLSNGKWAWAEQISPREVSAGEEILAKLEEGERSAEDLARELGISERDMRGELDRLESEEGQISSRQVFTRNDEYMLYSLCGGKK